MRSHCLRLTTAVVAALAIGAVHAAAARPQGPRLQAPGPRGPGVGDPSDGPAGAPVTIVEYADFECPFCRRLTATLRLVRERYGDRVRIVWRDYPLTRSHPHAFQTAVAARCAFEQGRFWQYHDRLFANQHALQPPALTQYAQETGLDVARFTACVASDRHANTVSSSIEAGNALGVTGTPTSFVNGKAIRGAKPIEVFTAAIDEELARLRP